MSVKKISISNFRCFDYIDLEFSELNNFIHGANGSGKTSILEALYFCSTGRSFKSSNKNLCIQNNKEAFKIQLETLSNNKICILKESKKSISFKINENSATSIDLFRAIPSTLLDNKTFSMFADTPKYRRKILDRCLMASDKSYSKDFFSFHRSLKQRNAALKFKRLSNIDMWSDIFINTGSSISDKRIKFFEETKNIFFGFSQNLRDRRVLEIINSLEIIFYRGWTEENSLNAVLDLNKNTDQRKTTTTSGPHRADIKFLIGGSDIKYILSRGEQKFMSILWCLSMHKTLSVSYGVNPFLIIDDIHSELDEGFYNELINFLPKTGNQLFFSDINNPFNSKIKNQLKELKKFHVEHFTNAKETK